MLLFIELVPESVGIFLAGAALVGVAMAIRSMAGRDAGMKDGEKAEKR